MNMKRTSAILLAILLLATAIPFAAFAATPDNRNTVNNNYGMSELEMDVKLLEAVAEEHAGNNFWKTVTVSAALVVFWAKCQVAHIWPDTWIADWTAEVYANITTAMAT